MRKGFDSLAAQAQTVLGQDPFSGHVFCFRGRRGDLVKLLWWDGDGLCLFAKRLERGRFVWPRAEEGVVVLSRAQLSMLLRGLCCVDALRGSRAFLAWDRLAGCGFVSGLFARPMAAGLDGLSATRGSHLDFALDAHPLAAGLPR